MALGVIDGSRNSEAIEEFAAGQTQVTYVRSMFEKGKGMRR